MTGSRAAICIHLTGNATHEQQERLATEYCVEHHIEPTTLVFHPSDALTLVKNGLVDVIVCAYLPADRADLAEQVEAAGGRLFEARPRQRLHRDIGRVFVRLFDRGMSVGEIAELTDEPTGEIRAELLRRGRRDRRKS